MDRTHLFIIDGHRIIINEEYSGIGYCYPRIFVEKSKDCHLNFDITIGGCFNQRLSDFESWLDGTERRYADLDMFPTVCKNCGLNAENTLAFIREVIAD